MNKVARKLAVFCLAIYCAANISLTRTNAASTMPIKAVNYSIALNPVDRTNFERHFQKLGVEGSSLIYDAQSDRTYQYNQQRNQKSFLPGSTFKILNSLISLETGVIDNELAILTCY